MNKAPSDVVRRHNTMLMGNVRNSFNEIGNKPHTQLPIDDHKKGNRENIAYELFLAKELVKMADTRLEKALTDAIECGLIFDHKKLPRDPGEYNLYNGSHVGISVTVSNGRAMVDIKKFKIELIKSNVNIDVVSECERIATKFASNGHSFKAYLIDDFLG